MSAGILISSLLVAAVSTAPAPPPVDAHVDYQLGEPYEPPAGTTVVARDWFDGEALEGGYSICYVNAFQTQDDDTDVDRPDERSNWPDNLVLTDLGDDPNWGGEYLIDISSAANRQAALNHVVPMIDVCGDKGFNAVEYDNLDSWARFDGTEVEGQVPFGIDDTIAYAELLTDYAHGLGMAVGQKNALELEAANSIDVIGFDFVVVEECGVFDECADFADVFGANIIDIEYTEEGFAAACESIGAHASVMLRDVVLTAPGSETYVYDSC